eukprot:653076-Rhodomonas_salina.2
MQTMQEKEKKRQPSNQATEATSTDSDPALGTDSGTCWLAKTSSLDTREERSSSDASSERHSAFSCCLWLTCSCTPTPKEDPPSSAAPPCIVALDRCCVVAINGSFATM